MVEFQHERIFGYEPNLIVYFTCDLHFYAFLDNDLIPWCHTCKYKQPNELGVGCTYIQFNDVDDYYGLGDYPCGDLDVVSVAPNEKEKCFLATPEIDIDENCAKRSLCLIKKESSLTETNRTASSLGTSIHFILFASMPILINY